MGNKKRVAESNELSWNIKGIVYIIKKVDKKPRWNCFDLQVPQLSQNIFNLLFKLNLPTLL